METDEPKGTVYYDPGAYGLELIFEKDLDNEPYQFNLICVWVHKITRKLYIGSDSGCSCPSPFENHYSLDSLEEINPFNIENHVELLREAGVSLLDVCELLETANELNELDQDDNEELI